MKSWKLNVCGKYTHFKGKAYLVYGYAYVPSMPQKEFVLYQQLYDKKVFWLREKNVFFETVPNQSESKERKIFRFKKTEDLDSNETIKSLIKIMKTSSFIVKEEASGKEYCIYKISTETSKIFLYDVEKINTSAYYSDTELATRMGFHLFSVDNKTYTTKSCIEYNDDMKLTVGENLSEIIEKQFNPCSIDLHISKDKFLKTKRKNIDPTSIEHIVPATHLWKPAKISKKNDRKYIKLKPNESLLTCIDEFIKIPSDCAGKIEIKSTFARLSLSITVADFCNPGYAGHFPLVIKNHGKHTVIIHPHEMMAQLILVNISCPIISNYSSTATHINNRGVDDGTPYFFWRERSIKALRQQDGYNLLVDFYYKVIENMTPDNVNDINAERVRFQDNFLSFAKKKSKKNKLCIKSKDDVYAVMNEFVSSEKIKDNFFKIRFYTLFATIIFPFLTTLFLSEKFTGNWLKAITISSIIFLILGIVSVALFIKKPKAFCTFEKFDYKNIDLE